MKPWHACSRLVICAISRINQRQTPPSNSATTPPNPPPDRSAANLRRPVATGRQASTSPPAAAPESTSGPPIHGELKMLGFEISERTVLRWMQKTPRQPEPGQRWKTFLANHREVIAAMDFFTVPTLTFGVLYCFFVIAHDRRKVLHLMSLGIQLPRGLGSNCGRPSPMTPRLDT